MKNGQAKEENGISEEDARELIACADSWIAGIQHTRFNRWVELSHKIGNAILAGREKSQGQQEA